MNKVEFLLVMENIEEYRKKILEEAKLMRKKYNLIWFGRKQFEE